MSGCEDELSSSEFENVGSTDLDDSINCIVTFSSRIHGWAFLKKVKQAIKVDKQAIAILNPNPSFVTLTGRREQIEALLQAEENKVQVAFLDTVSFLLP